MAEKAKKTLKFQMMMAPEEAEILDDWMFKNRFRSRAEAIRRLCQVGLLVSDRMPHVDRILSEIGDAAMTLQDRAKEAKSQDKKAEAIEALTNVAIYSTILHLKTIELAIEMKDMKYYVDESKSTENIDEFISKMNAAREALNNASGKNDQIDFISDNEGIERQ